jgi:hypothetical protein
MADASHEPEQIVLQREEYAYGFIIEVLTRGLYPDKLHVIREYVQNAYDAILGWRRASGDSGYGRIEVKIAPPSVFIYDNGVGMDRTNSPNSSCRRVSSCGAVMNSRVRWLTAMKAIQSRWRSAGTVNTLKRGSSRTL